MNIKVILTDAGQYALGKEEVVFLDIADGGIKVSNFASEIYIKQNELTVSVFPFEHIKRIELLLIGFNEMENKKYEDAREIMEW